jgi:Glycosyl hydrolases family 16
MRWRMTAAAVLPVVALVAVSPAAARQAPRLGAGTRSVRRCGSRPQPTFAHRAFREVFSDGFGGSALKAGDWTPGWFGSGVSGPVNSAETAAYDSANVRVHNGSVHLRLTGHPVTVGGRTFPHTGALISSNGKQQFAPPVAIEWQVRIPGGTPIADWPALWSDGQHWPVDGELDVLEGLTGAASLHFHSAMTEAGGYPAGHWAGWHDFGAYWQAGKVRWYWDGRKVGELRAGITAVPQYLVADFTTEAGDRLMLPATLRINHVRVWQPCG